MIDALQYGKGDWDASTRYLRDAQRSFPDNPHVRDAAKELALIRRLEEGQRAQR